jgi:hypothetical protein
VDWDRIYGPEHFFLNAVNVWHTKTDFIGTTATRNYDSFSSDFDFITEQSDYLAWLLEEVKKRQIRSERKSDYYVKYFTRYFAAIFRIFDIAALSLHEGGLGIYFVTQDNSHRGLHIQINRALADSLSIKGFKVKILESWERHHLGLRNISKRYRLVNPKQPECICHAFR